MTMVAIVEIWGRLSCSILPRMTIKATVMALVMPPGRAREIMFRMKLPRMRLVLGIWERRKAGTPIVKRLIREIWDGTSG